MLDPAECGGLVLDTSVLINLLATEAVNAILEALSVPCHVPQQVLAEVCRDPVTGVIFPAERHPLREKSSGVSILALDGTELISFSGSWERPRAMRSGTARQRPSPWPFRGGWIW